MTLNASDIILRPADAAECRAGGMEPAEALWDSVNRSDAAFVVRADGVPLAYWGYAVSSTIGLTCHAWMLSTPAIERFPIFAARESLRLRDHLLSLYPEILCQVDTEYSVALGWLAWLGFHPYCPAPNPRFHILRATKDLH